MIKTTIQLKFPHQYLKYFSAADCLYVADYTDQTKLLAIKRGVEFFVSTPPTDIEFFTIGNVTGINIGGIPFDSNSFKLSSPRSQCECIVFPHESIPSSWVVFAELKYRTKNNKFNRDQILKAINQLYRTRYYYIQEGVISLQNCAYLIVSFPKQNIPFSGFIPPPAQLTKLKKTKNIILAFTNSISIVDGNKVDIL